jgi:D-alanyl-D-alanine carboxypeptidase
MSLHRHSSTIRRWGVTAVGLVTVAILTVTMPAAAGSPATAGPSTMVRLAGSAAGGGATALDRILAAQFAASPGLPGIAARVDGPGLHWTGAIGTRDRATGAPLGPHDTFRIASITKTFTAAAVLVLVDRHEVNLDRPISAYLPPQYRTMLTAGAYRPDRITVRQLLAHTSGLYDYATDDGYQALALADTHHRWTPQEQIGWAMAHGQPYGRPGELFHYSDTGYVLAARIVTAVTGLPQAAAYRSLLRYNDLGLHDTWFETLEPAPPGAAQRRAHQYLIEPDAGLDLDLYDADPSLDLYGGGGLVSSLADLNRFYAALFAGRVISAPSLRAMLTPVSTGDADTVAGLGLFALSVAGTTCWWHNGFWGAATLYCPKQRVSVSVTLNAFLADRAVPGALTDARALLAVAMATPSGR